MLAHAENAHLAEALLEETIVKHGIERDQLTIHADRGSPMIAKPVAHLLADLGVTKSHSRPHTSRSDTISVAPSSASRTRRSRGSRDRRIPSENRSAAEARSGPGRRARAGAVRRERGRLAEDCPVPRHGFPEALTPRASGRTGVRKSHPRRIRNNLN
jgi:hypothetical protein